jgi:hypothetical protein
MGAPVNPSLAAFMFIMQSIVELDGNTLMILSRLGVFRYFERMPEVCGRVKSEIR